MKEPLLLSSSAMGPEQERSLENAIAQVQSIGLLAALKERGQLRRLVQQLDEVVSVLQVKQSRTADKDAVGQLKEICDLEAQLMNSSAIAQSTCRWLETEVDSTLGFLNSFFQVERTGSFPLSEVKAFAAALLAVGNAEFGEGEITANVMNWGQVLRDAKQESCTIVGKLDVAKHRSLILAEEVRFKDHLIQELDKLRYRYTHVSAVLMIHSMRNAVRHSGDLNWVPSLFRLHALINDNPKTCLHLTQIGWLMDFMTSQHELPSGLWGSSMNIEANVRKLHTEVLPKLISRVIDLRAAVADKVKTAEDLQTKVIAGAVSVAVPVLNFAIRLFFPEQHGSCS